MTSMSKLFGALAAVLLFAGAASAQYNVQRVPIAVAYDLDGLGVDADYNVLATQIADSKADYTISAQNEICRVNTVTIVDGDSSITAGVVTVTGTDCWGDALVCTHTFTDANKGSGTKSLVLSSGTANTCAFKTITEVKTGVITGEGGAADTLSVGYPALSGYVYPIYGVREEANGHRFINPFKTARASDDVTVDGTALASYNTLGGGFCNACSVGDLVYLTYGGKTFERRLVAVASADAATMDLALPSAVAPATTARVRMDLKHRWLLREDQDAWIPVAGAESAFVVFDVDANADTGGVISSVECSVQNAFTSDAFDPIVQVDTDTVASAATGTNTTSIDLRLAGYTHCRVGMQFGTTDDADAANEDINVIMMVTRKAN